MAEQINNPTIDENRGSRREGVTLYGVLQRSILMIIFPDAPSSASTSLLQRIKLSVSENGPRLREASRITARTVMLWTRGGHPLRALLVSSVGLESFGGYGWVLRKVWSSHSQSLDQLIQRLPTTHAPLFNQLIQLTLLKSLP